MTDDDRKLLTKYLGECWHEYNGTSWVCQNCFKAHTPKDVNRTFDNWPDFGALKDKIVERGEWKEFWAFCYHAYCNESQLKNIDNHFPRWVINKDHFPSLVVEAIRARVIGR